MVDVFLSYSRKDKEPVARLARAIEDEGYDVWWDAELPPHQSYGDVITSKITEAKAAIVVWSDDAAASEWVRAEADMARNQRKLVQTALGDIMPPLPFNQIQYADIGDWKGEADHPGWRKVTASLADLCGHNGPDPSVAAATEPAFAPPPAAVQEEYTAAAEANSGNAPSKWPLFAGLAVGAIAIAGAAAFVMLPAEEPAVSGEQSEQVASLDDDLPSSAAEVEEEPEAPPPSTRPAIPENWILATVEDADGHSNVRARPSTVSAIVSQVQVGETFRTRREAGNWWPVELADGTEGYIAKRLIRVRGSNQSPPAPGSGSGSDGSLLPNSSTAQLSANDMAGFSASELRIARNEIYARKGFIFQSADLTAHFEQFAWYQPTSTSVQLNATEQANVQLIQSIESAGGN